MAGSLGIGLNMGATTSGGGAGGYIAAALTGGAGACFFELDGAGALKPLEEGTVTDYNTIWDLDGTNYTPQETPVTDCNWDASGSTGSYELAPKDV